MHYKFNSTDLFFLALSLCVCCLVSSHSFSLSVSLSVCLSVSLSLSVCLSVCLSLSLSLSASSTLSLVLSFILTIHVFLSRSLSPRTRIYQRLCGLRRFSSHIFSSCLYLTFISLPLISVRSKMKTFNGMGL